MEFLNPQLTEDLSNCFITKLAEIFQMQSIEKNIKNQAMGIGT